MSVTNSNSVDHVMLIMRGIQSVTSLLLMATWRPEPGNPMIGSKLHTYRHRNIPFLDSKYFNLCNVWLLYDDVLQARETFYSHETTY